MPLSGIIKLPPNVTVVDVIDISAVPPISSVNVSAARFILPQVNSPVPKLNPANVGLSPVPSPIDVRAVAPDSQANVPAPVATRNSPSAVEAPRVSKSSSKPSTAKVLFAVISPPPVKPVPAVNVTPLCAICSSATKPDKLS